jgi:hypothetical protein
VVTGASTEVRPHPPIGDDRPVRRAAGLLAAAAVLAVASPASAASEASPTRLVRISDPRITESSGLAASPTDPDVLWTVNDSGDSARAFAVSLRTGRTVAVLRERTDARDCEAMTSGRDAAGHSMLWIGDIGDNRADRASVVLRLLREPSPIRSVTQTPVNLRVRYPGGPADAESLIWTPDGRLLIVTKTLLGGTVLQVPPAAVRTALAGHDVSTPALATVVGHVSQVLPTDGVALPDGRLVVRDYTGATLYAPPAYDGQALVVQARLALPAQQQGETMAVVDGGRNIVVGSEGADQYLWKVAVPLPAQHATQSAGATSAGTVDASPNSDRSSGRAAPAGRIAGVALIAVAVLAATAGVRRLARTRRRANGP